MYRKILYKGENIIIYRNFSIYQENIYRERFKICDIPSTWLFRILSWSRLLCRLLRLEPRVTCKLSDNYYLFTFFKKLWILNISEKKCNVLEKSRPGFSDPLNLCVVDGVVYWGEYGNNEIRQDVRIYKYSENSKVEVVHIFANGEIRHIHNILYDKNNFCFWIFTGDNELKSGIYQASYDWSSVNPIKVGEQKYRTVVGFPIRNGLLYATDSVDKINHICCLVCVEGEYEYEELIEINGSCIYGIEKKDYYVFSTTVEPQEQQGKKNLFSNKIGEGIKNREIHIVAVRKKDFKVKVIAMFKKDWWWMKLFQYGVVTFPSGQMNDNILLCYPIACKKVDGKILSIDIDKKYIEL